MSLALTPDQRDISDAVRSFLVHHDAAALARRVVDDPETDTTGLWKQLAELGWLALHLPSRFGGEDADLSALAIVAEELGHRLVPVPFLASVAASAALAAAGTEEQQARWLPRFADGSAIAGLGIAGTATLGGEKVTGDAGLVVGAAGASVLAITAGEDLVLVSPDDTTVSIVSAPDFEPTLRIARVSLNGATPIAVISGVASRVRHVARVLAAAEAAGGARATMQAALAYAKVREQFGRAIGSFQAIKHHLANMLATGEIATAVAWDAARAGVDGAQAALALDAARVIAFDSYVTNAEMSIQIHGGIGYTWEHDCHLFLRRALTLRALYGETKAALDSIAASHAAGARRHYAVDLPAEAEQFREQAGEFVSRYTAAPAAQQRALLVESGYLMPHWPTPFGRSASPIEQLVIDEEFADLVLPRLGIGGWILLTLTQHANDEQIQRWIRPGLMGELTWCQLFSEPGAGSDAAAVSTRGVKVDGGWRVTGQKVWTSDAQNCNRGFATIRTNRDVAKHKGITTMVIDLNAPGVTVRPLREITGDAVFNEVFFDEVFVPDADVVGPVDAGWTVARATLGNERVSIGGGAAASADRSAAALLDLAGKRTPDDLTDRRAIAHLIAREQAISLLNVRQVVRAVAGADPGPEGSVTKLLIAEHAQHVGELGLRLAGAAVVAGDAQHAAVTYLESRCMTIAGGTSEVNRNVIAERLLGLPREHIAN